jgi:hypothetical protein
MSRERGTEGPQLEMEKGLPPNEVDRRLVAAARADMIAREGRVAYGVLAPPNFGSRDPRGDGSRDPAFSEGWHVGRVPDWTALDPKLSLGSIGSENIVERHRRPLRICS